MNARELKKKLQEISMMNLELFSGPEIKKIGSDLDALKSKIISLQVQTETAQIFQTLPLQLKPFFEYKLQEKKLTLPERKASIDSWKKYKDRLEKIFTETKSEKKSLLTALDKIFKAEEEQGLLILKKLKPKEKIYLSLLAGLTFRTGTGVKKLNVSSKESENRKWIRALKNHRHLDVLNSIDSED